ncbi:MAG: ribulokinase [Lentisphaeria bacterium]|nr:ribulokinase [Lentisphaeria bacterium]
MQSVIGIDFGSDSARAILVDTAQGNVLKESVFAYPRWAEQRFCDTSRCILRQHPADYLDALQFLISDVLDGQERSALRGIAIDATSSTVCAVDEEGVPLALHAEFQNEPDAMFFLWKDHSATAEADDINAAAEKWQGTDFRSYSGGSYSCEWFWSKALYVLRRNPAVAAKTASFVEHGDWMTALLCGRTTPSEISRSRCFAGHKAMWNASWGGVPPKEFFAGLDEKLARIAAEFPKETATADTPAGVISPAWAERFGIPLDVVIGNSLIDCHSGAVGAGVKPGELIKVVGTSSCDIIISDAVDRAIPGICGQVDGSVLPGFTGFEAGQAAFGDIFAWFSRLLSYGGAEVSLAELEKAAAEITPGSSGIVSTDFFNGRRTPYADAGARAVISGLTLGSSAPEIYRSLAEAAVMGAKRIVEHFQKNSVNITNIKAVGGISLKSPFIMQMFADILDMPVAISSASQACALGAAIFAAAAAGVYPDVQEAMKNMSGSTALTYYPDKEKVEIYRELYKKYKELAETV